MNAVWGKNRRKLISVCFDVTAVMETWWDTSHDWNAVMKGHTWLRKDRSRRCIGGASLYVRKHLECFELYLGWMMRESRG